jgi:transcriptional regulator with XRE-family HTH domain
MPVISKKFADELAADKHMRDAYVEETTRTRTAVQIKSIRNDRGWSQAELGQRVGKPQSNVHRLEDVEVARYTLTTLLELASAYDCGLVVDFVPYEEFLRRTEDLSPENFRVPQFDRRRLAPLTGEAVSHSNVLVTELSLPSDLENLAITPVAPTYLVSGAIGFQPGLMGLYYWNASAFWPNQPSATAVLEAQLHAEIQQRDAAIAVRNEAIKERDRLRAECEFLRKQLIGQGFALWHGVSAAPTDQQIIAQGVTQQKLPPASSQAPSQSSLGFAL